MYHTLHLRCCRPDLVLDIFLSVGLSCRGLEICIKKKKCLKQLREAKKNMKPLCKVKGFEQYTSWTVHVLCMRAHVAYIYVHMKKINKYIKYVITVILRAVARDMLYVTRIDWRIRAGVVLDQLSNLSGFSFNLSLLSFPLLSSHLYLFSSLSLFVSFISSSLLFASVLWRVLCCVVVCAVYRVLSVRVCVCRCVMCLELNSVFR